MNLFISTLLVTVISVGASSCRSTKKTTRIEDEKSEPSVDDTDSDDLKKIVDPVPPIKVDPADEIKTVSWSLTKDSYTAELTKTENVTKKTATYAVMVKKADDEQFDTSVQLTGDPVQGMEVSFFEKAQSPNASFLSVKILNDNSCSIRWESNGEIDIFTLIFTGDCS